MGMLVDKDMKELMIDTITGRLFKRELSVEEKARVILKSDFFDAAEKLDKLTKLGLELEMIVEMALYVDECVD